jgi:hypothetical protein
MPSSAAVLVIPPQFTKLSKVPLERIENTTNKITPTTTIPVSR